MRTKEELFNYIGKEDSVYGYSRSYKLVLFRILFTDLWEYKRSYLYDVAAQFKDFYVKRIAEGKVPDKDVDERIQNILFAHAYRPWNEDEAFGRKRALECIADCRHYEKADRRSE